jgi:type IV secretory pathway VirD2 relaxase
LHDPKPFIRDFMAQVERDLETKLDWVAVDHYNTATNQGINWDWNMKRSQGLGIS